MLGDRVLPQHDRPSKPKKRKPSALMALWRKRRTACSLVILWLLSVFCAICCVALGVGYTKPALPTNEPVVIDRLGDKMLITQTLTITELHYIPVLQDRIITHTVWLTPTVHGTSTSVPEMVLIALTATQQRRVEWLTAVASDKHIELTATASHSIPTIQPTYTPLPALPTYTSVPKATQTPAIVIVTSQPTQTPLIVTPTDTSTPVIVIATQTATLIPLPTITPTMTITPTLIPLPTSTDIPVP